MATWDINEQYDGLPTLTENDYEPYDKMGRMLIYRLNVNNGEEWLDGRCNNKHLAELDRFW